MGLKNIATTCAVSPSNVTSMFDDEMLRFRDHRKDRLEVVGNVVACPRNAST